MSRKHWFGAAGAGCVLAFLACDSVTPNPDYTGVYVPPGDDASTASGSGGSSGSSSGSSSGGSSGGSSGSSSGSSGGDAGYTLGSSSGSPTGTISLDGTTCSWTGGLAGTNATLAKNTAVLGPAGASYANKLNPTCKVCPTSPTADEPTGCPKYTAPATVTAGSFPGLGFDPTYDLGATQNQPVYIPNDVVIPTLDDAPDGADANMGPTGNDGYTPGEWTITDLAFLDAVGQHFDIFMNSDNWATVTTNPADGTCDADGYDAYIDILKNHFPANHTAHHVQMGSDFQGNTTCFQYGPTQPQCCDCSLCPTTDCATEVGSLEALVAGISNNGRTHLTRFRYPYGWPVQTKGAGLADVQPKVAKFAVQIGWHFLTDDADNSPCGCQETTGTKCTCVDESKGDVCSTDQSPGAYDNVTADYSNFVTAIGSGPGKGTSWGIALMHATTPWTAGTLRKLFGPSGYVSTTTYRIGTVEDAICWKYGMHSWEVVNKVNGYTGADARGPN